MNENIENPVGVRALTVARPWAGLIIAGHKTIENRTWSTRYRGRLVVHAGKRWDTAGALLAEQVGAPSRPDDHHTGYLGTVDLVGLHHADECASCSTWAMPQCWHWQLADPTAFPRPLAGTGRLGLFTPPKAVGIAAAEVAR
jgi:hypothetical protein